MARAQAALLGTSILVVIVRNEGRFDASYRRRARLILFSSETCMAVEMMYSMAYLYRIDGLNHYADMAERPAFNALPAAISPDCESTNFLV
jgi:DUF1680 family protein